MDQRYYLPQITPHTTTSLTGAEAHHLLHVMRADVGDAIVLFDGLGNEFPSTVEKRGRSEVIVAIGQRRTTDHSHAVQLTLAVALPKGDRQKWLVEKLTELGVMRLIPLVTERSVVDVRGKSLTKLERVVIEACKQCGRNQLMTIEQPIPFTEYVRQPIEGFRLIAHPREVALGELDLHSAQPITTLVGPEGGFTDAEVEQARAAGWQPVKLGTNILRIETAAIAIAAAVALRG